MLEDVIIHSTKRISRSDPYPNFVTLTSRNATLAYLSVIRPRVRCYAHASERHGLEHNTKASQKRTWKYWGNGFHNFTAA